MSDPTTPPSPVPPPAALAAWLAISDELLALTDAHGLIEWRNPAFARVAGTARSLHELAPRASSDAAVAARARIDAALRDASVLETELQLEAADGAPLWLRGRIARHGAQWLWALRDVGAERALAAQARRDAELFALAQDLGRVGLWERDIVSGEGHWDQQVFGIWGLEPQDGTPRFDTLVAQFHPDDPAEAVFRESLLRAGRYSQRYRIVRPDGSLRRILAHWEVRNGPNDRPARAIGIVRDETEVYDLASSLDATAVQLALAVDLGGILVWRHHLGSRRLHFNEHGRAFLGLPHDSDGTGEVESRRFIHPDDLAEMISTTRAALTGGAPVDIEVRVRRSDGAWRYMLTRRVVERGPEGMVVAVVGVALDVTERRATANALHTANERAALIARHAGIGTWETDADRQPALWDEQMFRLRGLTPRAVSLSREERLALVHPDDLAHVLDTRPELDGSAQPTAYEFRVRWPDGQYRWLASRSAPLFDALGKVVRRVGVNWDITDHKNAELARQQALLAERESRAKSQFLARMSHELRTPLNAVLGFTQLLQLDAQQRSAPDQFDKLSHIRAAGEHLLTLINDALDLSSLEAGTLKLDLQPVSLALAMTRALPLVEESAAARRITIRSGRLEGTVRADFTRLHQVLLNLLSNAVKYNRVGGEVVIESALTPGHVRLRVRDTGRGMNAAQLARLFEPFNRLGVDHDGIEGSGIGMTIARALVEGMGGRIGVSSEPDRGTTFEVVLPRAGTEVGRGARDPEPIADGGPAPRAYSGQVLYIEDNAVNVLLVEQLMAQMPGLRLTSEANGAAGVARAAALRPDLILIDMQLPDFDGFEVLRRLRAAPATAAIACIALSANAIPEDIARARAAGFDDYWTKPIRFREFLAAMALRFPAGLR